MLSLLRDAMPVGLNRKVFNLIINKPFEMTASTSYLRMASKLLVFIASCIASPDASPDASHLPVAFGGYEIPYCPNGGSCVPPSACAPFYLNALHDPVGAACYLAPGTPGICCVPRHTSCK